MKLVVRREVEPAVWDAYVEQHPEGWFWHTSGWLEYQLCRGGIDASVAIVDRDVVVGLVPLVVEGGTVVIEGQPAPLFTDDGVARWASLPVNRHCVAMGIRAWPTRDRPQPLTFRESVTRVVALDRSTDDLWSDVRKSYHAIINKAQKTHIIEAHPSSTWLPIARTCSALHATAAGRVTRHARTWELMEQWAREGRALLVTATPTHPGVEGNISSYLYVYAWMGWAYYGSSVAEKNLAHALQWTAICALHCRGAQTHYEIGYLPDHPTEKDQQIRFFKQGFGGTDWFVRTSLVEFRRDEDVSTLA